jgi:hypothetical protein
VKQKSKSSILNSIMSDVDQQLSSIPSFDTDGCPIEDSMHFDMYIDGITTISFKDGLENIHYPFGRTIATILVFDELEERNNQPEEKNK